jgi:hypothetical protein
MKLSYTLSALIWFTFSYSGSGQQSSTERAEIERYFADAAAGKSYAVSNALLTVISLPNLISLASPGLSDKDAFVRYKAIDLIRRKGMLTSDKGEKSVITSLLTEACKDSDSGNSGVASKSLLLFNTADFTSQTVDSMNALLIQKPFYYERIIRIAGFIKNERTAGILQQLKDVDSTLSKKEKWAVDLALARTGNAESLEYCMGKIKSIPVSDDAVSYLFPDLLYLRQPAALDYMLQEVLSDEKKCHSSNPDNEKPIVCAFRILELVAPVIDGFPVKLTSYGELEVNNYDEALKSARTWISSVKNYEIVSNIY